jgi:hypothetical protein
MDQWHVMIKEHHIQYISYEEYEKNNLQLQLNKVVAADIPLAGAAREGATLLQGLLVCGVAAVFLSGLTQSTLLSNKK